MCDRSFVTTALVAISLGAGFGASPAAAGNAVSFVSGKGSDGGNSCAAPATPCRSFAHALTQTNAGGEIKALDPASYGSVNIAKSVTITGVRGTSIETTAADDGVIIDNAAAIVNLRGIEIKGKGVGVATNNGVSVGAAKTVNIVDCIVRHVFQGIFLAPSAGAVSVTIAKTILSNNGNGILFFPGSGASIEASVDHVTTNDNAYDGIVVAYNTTAMISDSIANNNANSGFRASGNAHAKMYLARSVASGNKTGIDSGNGATVRSFRDNEVYGNGTDVIGPMGVAPSK